jgi:hypothetical protein
LQGNCVINVYRATISEIGRYFLAFNVIQPPGFSVL